MNKLSIIILKVLRKAYQKMVGYSNEYKLDCDQDPDTVSHTIYEVLISDKPCMISRFGSNELNCIINYLAIIGGKKSLLSYIKGDNFQWWWNPGIIKNLHLVAGFFPPQDKYLNRFCELMIKDMSEVDILGSWLNDELKFRTELSCAKKVQLDFLNPFFSKMPWSIALANKKVLVIHPFSETIKKQYENRKLLFENKSVLPEFSLQTIKAVQSFANVPVLYKDWFDALNYMQNEIDKCDYDICLIGCGAYGFPLAAHVKRMGKKAVHLGGSLQLLFGIKGKRWEDPNLNKGYCFASFMNENWVRPSEDEKPLKADKVEGACYW